MGIGEGHWHAPPQTQKRNLGRDKCALNRYRLLRQTWLGPIDPHAGRVAPDHLETLCHSWSLWTSLASLPSHQRSSPRMD